MKSVKIVYGSCGGNTELVCRTIACFLEKNGIEVTVFNAKNLTFDQVGDFDLLILASPTYGHGQLEQYFEKFLLGASDWNLENKDAVAVGLGDRKYDSDYHIESYKIIEEFLHQKRANVVSKALALNGDVVPQLMRAEDWASKLIQIYE